MPTRTPSSLDLPALRRLLRAQDGVVARGQLVSIGASRADVRRMLSRRELVEVHPRVYVTHTGRPSRLAASAINAVCWERANFDPK